MKLFDRFEKELRATIRPIPVSVFLGIFGLSFALPPVCYLLGWPEGINWVLTGLLFLLTPVALVFVSRQLLTRRQRAPYVRVLPRLWGAVLVGYLPLVTEASLWTACDSLSGPTSVFLVVASITIAWGYIYVSVTQRVRNYEKAMSRATILTTVGLLQSLFVGLLLFSTIGAPLAEEALQARQQTLMPEKTGVAHEAQQEVTANQRAAEEDSMMIELRCPWNPFDLVRFPARPLFVWCPVALFLGVVLQLLWIDRSIVDPV